LTAAIGEGGAAITAELVPAVELTMSGSVVRACVVTVAATGSTVVLVVKFDALELAGVEPGDDTNAALGCTAVPTGALVATVVATGLADATVVLVSSTATGGSVVLVAETGASVTTAASAAGSAVVTVATVAEVPVGVVAAAVVIVSSEVAS
jgi:hypothetical protein